MIESKYYEHFIIVTDRIKILNLFRWGNDYEAHANYENLIYDYPITSFQVHGCRFDEISTLSSEIITNLLKIPLSLRLKKKIFKKNFRNINTLTLNLDWNPELAKDVPGFLKNLDGFDDISRINVKLQKFMIDNNLRMFDEIFNIESLSIWGCFPKYNSFKLFSKRSSIKNLELSSNDLSCGIEILFEDSFKTLHKLKKLEMHNHNIEKLPENLFKSNFELENIDLLENNIKVLPENLFEKIEKSIFEL